MKLIYTGSLAATVDAVNEAFFFPRELPVPQRRAAAQWIAARAHRPGSYAQMPAPTNRDLSQGIRLFTGERITTRAGITHILGQEACRAMILLTHNDAAIREALAAADKVMAQRLATGQKRPGMYCCGRCSCAMWRHLAVAPSPQAARLLTHGLKTLKEHRDGTGRWKVFPFHYTLTALIDIDLPAAKHELQYAAPSCQRLLARKDSTNDKYALRRRALAERVLART